ncbi:MULTISPECIES: LysR family transcriptional regulator [Paraburkholderia]|uniref:DNA-binding transcriptional LysR family regulator n=2 Tax=Paraburkholderia TaxID=1822464 RepID=A0A7Y9WSC3_9BURK|nr:LysR family transcriptional regulator [Paraburkholderia bryophila]NYH16326.1 DNA-binding transcriptional LysR family regulator [Paraburkholderia bryophila]NYH25246.1 DNA-binding transcriptional LysR family regulator [Paraburkholderia bryophila]
MDLLDSMRVFVRAVDAGSLSAAAADCGMSSTMAGNHLRALEKRTGMKLLNRTTRRQSLTEFGESYYVRCQEILRLVAAADTHAENRQAVPSGTLRVTAPVSFGSEALAPALGDYLAQYPQVEVELSLSDHTVDLLEHGFDAAIRIGAIADTGLVARPLAPYRMMICASPGYLAARGTPQHPDDLAGHECLAFSSSSGAPWRLSGAEGTSHVAVTGRLRVNHGQALRVAALQGVGIVMQPAVLLQADVAAGRLVQVLDAYELPSRPMHLVYFADHRSPKLRSFVEFALQAFGE